MDKYIKISDLKSKLNYIFRTYGVGKATREAINNAISKIPYVVIEDDCYIDELGGHHDCGVGWNPNGYWCGECPKSSCEGCVNIDKK